MPKPPLRVTFDHQIFAMQSYGGISRYFCELAGRMLNDPTLSIRVVAPLYVNHYLRASHVEKLGAFVPAIRGTHRLRAALANITARPLIAHTRPHILHQTFYARRCVVPERSKLVITVHDLIHERMPHLFPRHDRTRERKEKAIQAADHIICVSEYTRGELTKIYGVAPERTSVVHHGCNPPPAMVDTAPRSDRPYILYVGARDGYKNFEAILQALSGSKLSRSLDVVAFGGPPWTMRDASLVRRNGLLEGRVRYRSGQDEDLAGLYRRAEALIVPSFVEGFGLPILEAMSLGCPVICSGTTSLPEVAGDAAQYFDPGDPSSIAAAIESVVGNARRREDLVRRGSARVLDFSWERTAAKTRDVYMKTAGLPAG